MKMKCWDFYYVSPLALGFSEEDDEFDFLLYLSRILNGEERIIKFDGFIKYLFGKQTHVAEA